LTPPACTNALVLLGSSRAAEDSELGSQGLRSTLSKNVLKCSITKMKAVLVRSTMAKGLEGTSKRPVAVRHAGPKANKQDGLCAIRTTSASHLQLLYLAGVLLRHSKHASQQRKFGCRIYMCSRPKMNVETYKLFNVYGEGMDGLAPRTLAGPAAKSKSSQIALAKPHQCSGLENLHGTKIGCTARCTATKHKSSTYASPKGFLAFCSSLQYFAPRESSAKRNTQ